MTEPNPGTPLPVEQVQNGPQPTEQAPAVPPGQPSPTDPPQPSVEDIQRQLQRERTQREQLETNYKSLQGEFTRRSQALAQLTGNTAPNQPPADPLAPYVQELVSQGYDEKSARAVSGIAYKMVQPLQQQVQQTFQINQQAASVDYGIQQLAQLDPNLITTQQDYNAVRETALQLAQNGGVVDQATLVNIAALNRYHAARANPAPTPVQPAAPPPQPFAHGMFRPQSGFSPQFQPPAKPQGPQTAEGQALDQFFKDKFTKK